MLLPVRSESCYAGGKTGSSLQQGIPKTLLEDIDMLKRNHSGILSRGLHAVSRPRGGHEAEHRDHPGR